MDVGHGVAVTVVIDGDLRSDGFELRDDDDCVRSLDGHMTIRPDGGVDFNAHEFSSSLSAS